MHNRVRLFAGTADPAFAQEISAQLGIGISPSMAHFFTDGNLYVKLNANVRGGRSS